MKYKTHLIIAMSCLLVGRYVLQPKATVQIKEVIKYVEKKQVKENKQKTTKVTQTTKKDGTVVKEVTVVENTNKNTNSNTKLDKTAEVKKTTGSGITLGVLAVKDLDSSLSDKPEVGVLAIVPIFGRLSLAGTLDTGKRVGVGLAVEF
jgi:hypothetical protein